MSHRPLLSLLLVSSLALPLVGCAGLADILGRSGSKKEQEKSRHETADAKEAERTWRASLADTKYAVLARENPSESQLAQVLDSQEVPSEIVRARFVQACLGRATNGEASIASYALCGEDARRLNQSAFQQELAATGWNEAGKRWANELWGKATAAADKENPRFARLAKTDPAYESYAIATSEKAFADWDGFNGQPGMRAARSIEQDSRNTSRKAMDGCMERIGGHFEEIIRSGKPQSTKELAELLGREDHWLVTRGYVACAASEEATKLRASSVLRFIDGSKGPYGPRMATYLRLKEAKVEFDDKSVRVGQIPTLTALPLEASVGRLQSLKEGVVDSIKTDGDVTTLSFRRRKIQDSKCVNVVKHAHGGTVVDRVCTPNGFHWTSEVNPKIATKDAAGIKKGQSVSVAWGDPGVSVLVYSSDDEKTRKLLQVFGIDLTK